MSAYKSYAITVRPLDGATHVHDDAIMKFLRKYCEYYYAVSEKTGTERHIHAGLFMKKAVIPSNMKLMLRRVLPMLSDDERRVLNQGVKIMYNMDFITNYLDKDDDTEVLMNCLPEEATLDSYWPPSKDQQKAQAMKATDKFYANLEFLWFQHMLPNTEISKQSCQDFLFSMMFEKRLIKVLRDRKAILTTSEMLFWYLSKANRGVIERPPWEV